MIVRVTPRGRILCFLHVLGACFVAARRVGHKSFGAVSSLLNWPRLGSRSTCTVYEDRVLCVIVVRATAIVANVGGRFHFSQSSCRRMR